MPGKRLSLRKIREVLRLKYELNRSYREIGLSCDIGSSTVGDYILRVRNAGLKWQLPEGHSDIALETIAFSSPNVTQKCHLEPAMARILRTR